MTGDIEAPEEGNDFLEAGNNQEFDEGKVVSMLGEILSLLKGGKTMPGKQGYPYKYPEAQKKAFDDLKKEKETLETKLQAFEKAEKDKKITGLLDTMEGKGLIQKEQRADMFKDYAEHFSVEQIDALITQTGKMDFEKAKQKSFSSGDQPEQKTKDFEKSISDLEHKMMVLKDAGVSGPVYEGYEAELKKLKGDN